LSFVENVYFRPQHELEQAGAQVAAQDAPHGIGGGGGGGGAGRLTMVGGRLMC